MINVTDADLTLFAKLGAGIVGAVWFAFVGRSWIKRRLSADGYVVAEDRAAVDMLKRALDEADRLRERADSAYQERNIAMQELGTLRATVKSLEEHRVDCDRRIEQMQKHCDQRIEEMERQLELLRVIVERRLTPRE